MTAYNSNNRGCANGEGYRSCSFRKVFVRENEMIQHEAEVEYRKDETREIVVEIGHSAHDEEGYCRTVM